MSDATPTLDTTAPAAPASPVEQKPESVNLETPAEASAEPAIETPVEEEFDEIDYDGDKYKVPRKLKDGFLMQSDYTRKTQEVAEQRKALQAEYASFQQRAEAEHAHVRDLGWVEVMNEQIAQYDKIDWDTLNQNDPFKAQTLFQQRQLLKDRRDGLKSEINAREHQRSQQAQQSFARRYAETNATLADPQKGIKGWSQDTANKLRDFAVANGATDEDIRTLAVNASLVKLLHKAWTGEQLITAKTAAAKTAEPKVEPKPLTKVSGAGARPAVDIGSADMETYVALRQKQGFGRR